ncbi:hypothetical protein BJY16_002846 [Actinoplanes octamycinicus]|uniref:Gram-positive cocci surface proteins LPxTG domain-containing protein n=1 Tax=Actinoplanes octamycinicus TaxID=135948 RepID=A0A7W7GWE6_9ACTN|nr:hypothetical protein [Actinoplanes octamycinicus]MBB4739387.1 hypothetical protein [Actinoplanes octamycinicus]GIE63519.1 hypothetical protein Aoc01nite_89210 [Actinoplanes octamycinicus]
MRWIGSAAATVMIMVMALLPGTAARAAAVFVELNPSTVPAGDHVSLRASCTDNLQPATVTVEGVGPVRVKPEFGFLTATAKVPGDTEAGDYTATLQCPDGKTATATMHVVVAFAPSRGPATGGGGTAPERTAALLVGGGLTILVAGLGLAVLSTRRRRLG